VIDNDKKLNRAEPYTHTAFTVMIKRLGDYLGAIISIDGKTLSADKGPAYKG
jgi:hypothetical protein